MVENNKDLPEYNKETGKKKNILKRVLIGGVSLIALTSAILGISQNNKVKKLEAEIEMLKESKAPIESTIAEEEVEAVATETEQPVEALKDYSLTDSYESFENVMNEEELSARAEEIYSDIKEIKPKYLINPETVERDIEWIAAGEVDKASIDEAVAMIKSVEGLMNMEMEDATLYYHDKADTIENKKTIDFSGYVEDHDVMAKTLISKIYELRKGMIEANSREEAREYAIEFTNLLGDSWFAKGWDDEVNTLMLETSGYKALAIKYFLNTAMLATAIDGELTYVCPPQDDETATVTLISMIEQLNEATCLDNGQYINDFSEAMNGMIEEAEYNYYNSQQAKLTLQNRG